MSRQVRKFCPSVEVLEDRVVPSTIPTFTGQVNWAPFTAPGTPILFTPFSVSGSPTIKFTTPLASTTTTTSSSSTSSGSTLMNPNLLSTIHSAGFIPSNLMSSVQTGVGSALNNLNSSSTQPRTQTLQSPSGSVSFNPLTHGNMLNPGFTNFASF